MFQIHHIDIWITNIEKSIQFYELLGFKMVKEFELPDKKIILLQLDELYLEMKYSYLESNFSNIKDNKIFGLAVDNIYDAKKYFQALQMINEEIEIKIGILNKKYFMIHDPNDMLIEIIEK